VRPANEVVDHVLDRLVYADVDSGKLEQARVELAHEVGLGFAFGPGVIGRQPDRCLDVRRRPGVDSVVLATELGDDVRYLRKFTDSPAQLVGHFARGLKGQSAGQLHLQPQRTFVELRKIIPPDLSTEHSDGDESETRCEIRERRQAEQPVQQAAVASGQPFQRPVAECGRGLRSAR
jgi:hypothetical protein